MCLTLCRVYKLQSVCTYTLLHVREGVCVCVYDCVVADRLERESDEGK